MGGRGPGHKSERARAARRRNIQKARAARRRPPLPWRSGLESRVIEQLVWQWWNDPGPRKWPAYRVARFLGISHTWVAKLVKRFRADPARAHRRMRAFAPADLEKLGRARQETQWHRQHGRLRGPIRWRRVKYAQDRALRSAVVPNQSETRRAAGRREPPPIPPRDRWPSWAAGFIAPTDLEMPVAPSAISGSIVSSFAPGAIAGSSSSSANLFTPSPAARQSAPPNTAGRERDLPPADHAGAPFDPHRPRKPLEPKRKGPIPFAFRRPRR